jgi:hypothetical protein
MKKQVVRREDGRAVIYYTFEDETPSPAGGDEPRENSDE